MVEYMDKKILRSLVFLAMLVSPIMADEVASEDAASQPSPAVEESPSVPAEPVASTQPAEASETPEAEQVAAEPAVEPVAPAQPAEVSETPSADQPAAAPAQPAQSNASGSTSQSASIFVQDPAIFHQRQTELEKLKKSVGNKNEGLDSLLAEASHFAKMNDQCASISINDVMGDECWTFYRVELPAFEERYMRVTGEVRLGHMETARGLEDRKLQIDACVDALYSFAQSKDQFLNLDGGVFLEPLSKGFQANYDFTLQYEPNHRKHAFEIAQKWGETCREMVVRKDGEGFAPFFLEKLVKLNADLANNGSLAVYKTDTTAAPTLFMDISKPVRSAYYLNGVKLFHSRISAGPVSESPVRIKFEGKSVKVDGEPIVMKRGKMQKFKGSVEYPQKESALNGRWIWENQGNTAGVDFGPEEDEAVLDSIYAAELASKAAEAEKRRGVRFSPWIGVTGAFAPFSDKNYQAFELEKDQLMILPDLTLTARVKVGLGETGDFFAAAGAGVFVGAGLGDGLQRVYIAPVGQAEVGYGRFGVRETAVIALPKDDSKEWMQFRTGLFCGIGWFGIEAGFDFITNLGQGGYATLYWSL